MAFNAQKLLLAQEVINCKLLKADRAFREISVNILLNLLYSFRVLLLAIALLHRKI